MTKDSDALALCPFCGTEMHRHEKCFSHPRPASGECILRHYSFDDADGWNRRAYADTIERQAAEIERMRWVLEYCAAEAAGNKGAFRSKIMRAVKTALSTKETSHDR